jgi:hypothetical protein
MLAAAALCAGEARAQICAGFPTADREFSFGGEIAFPENANFYGVEGNYNAAGPFAFSVGIGRLSFDNSDTDLTVFNAGAAFDFSFAGTPSRPYFSVCPLVEIEYAKEGDVSVRSIPIGVGVGSSFPIGAGGTNTFMPYIIPAIVFSRVEVEDLGSDSDSNVGLKLGALFGFGRFYAGAEMSHVFDTDSDPTFGVRVGVKP